MPDGGERARLLDEIAARAEATVRADHPPGVGEFVRRYYAGVPLEDLQTRDVENLGAIARSHWLLAAERPPGGALVRVTAPARATHGYDAPTTSIDVVTDDMPFLVDSVTMELDRHGLGMHLVVHPQIPVVRDADGRLLGLADGGAPPPDGASATATCLESFMHVEVDRETDAAALAALRDDVLEVLDDVRAAYEDWRPMVATAHEIADTLGRQSLPLPRDDVDEARALLEWMADNHFTFLGFREYDLRAENGEEALCAVSGSGLGILRTVAPRSRSFAAMPPAVRRKAREPALLVLTKANTRATVHRPTYLDYVGVKKFDDTGTVCGEWRFLGLFTATAYHASPSVIPIVRRKVAEVERRAGFLPGSHDQKRLLEILETYPRDELIQISVEDLYDTVTGILALQERRRVRLFARRDVYDRFVTCLVYIPRDRYTTALRLRTAALLVDAFGAVNHEWTALVTESPLARLEFTLHTDPDDHREVDVAELEARIAAAARTWTDELREALVAREGEERGQALLRRYADAFPIAYQESVDAADALLDIDLLEALGRDPARPRAARLDLHADAMLCTLAGTGGAPSLSDVLPVLRNLGLTAVDEYPHDVTPAGIGPFWLKRIGVRGAGPVDLHRGPHVRTFEEALLAVLDGAAEDDGFNRLVLGAGLSWREVALLRAYSRYLRQTVARYSLGYVEDTLARHPWIARRLVELFVTRFHPRRSDTADLEVDGLQRAIEGDLQDVPSLDEDRILRSLLHVLTATLRTNWFQGGADGPERPCLAVKLDSRRIPDLPKPRPMFEIFVYSPRVEGVHLRGGRVARGGIRWSDRREDYRTEVLGLMKAQMVKNAVIVPVGAKGGFVVQRPPADPDALRAEVAACYRLFIDGLLDVTDNLVDGAVVPPPEVVRYDGDDPYLVVAADKGTATFSDLANEIATARGYWLGDAFASGGSTGYDHKKMGITARGAWESVRRHFNQLGMDPDRTEFTVVGIGDMSGDVFGNGMLLSRHLRLVAAFDHRHVFLDPDPDPAKSFEERARLFALPRSSWADYDAALISPGGGVFPRAAKAIPVTPEVAARLGISRTSDTLTPAEMIRAILTAPVDLLWNGGIGTYVKASTERDPDVGDKANDAVRVNGADLRCKVVVEGGNLGLTQRGRVEFALRGGLVNTDAIDNSAGVDASDHEVNIKILLDAEVRAGQITVAERNALLAEMTDEVTTLVLRDNYRQNRALVNALVQAAAMEDVHARYLRDLEHAGDLDRPLEGLPSDEDLADRRQAGIGLVQPELAVLLAYAKITLAADLVESDVPDDPDLDGELVRYFPSRLHDESLHPALLRHPLRREIVATSLVNGMVNRAGMTFAFRMHEETGAATPQIVRAHEVARRVFDQESLWREIERLDREVSASTETDMYLESRKLLERASRWFLRYRRPPLPVNTTVEHFRDRVRRVADVMPGLLLGGEQAWLTACTDDFASRGVPYDLARRVASLESQYTALDVVDLADVSGREVEEIAALYCLVGDRLQLDWLRDRVVELPRADRWQSLSRLALREDAYAEHKALTASVLARTPAGTPAADAFDAWAAQQAGRVERMTGMVDDIRSRGVYDLATLSVALREIRSLRSQA